jgi:hypothetical protein
VRLSWYTIDPAKVEEFERFGRAWIALVNRSRIRDESGCVLRYERTFMRPVLEGQLPDR